MVESWQAKLIRAGHTAWNYGALMAQSVGGDFFGCYDNAAGVVMAVAHEEIHSLVHGQHQAPNLG